MPETSSMVQCKQCGMPTSAPWQGLCLSCHENSLMSIRTHTEAVGMGQVTQNEQDGGSQ
jgi:hypothetical protein